MDNKYYKLSIAVFISLGLLAVAFLFLKNSFSYSDVDLGWHLRLGQDWLATGQAAHINNYNYTLLGQSWVDHEWLLNAFMILVFKVGNFLALHLTFLMVLCLATFLAWRRSYELLDKRLGAGISSAFWLFWGLLASRPHLGIRVQEFALVGLAWLFLLFSNYRRYRLYFWSLPFLFILWANMHGSFILGLALLAAYCFYVFLSPFLKYFDSWHLFSSETFPSSAKWQLLIVFILSVAATFINPYGLGLYAFLSTYLHTAYMVYIREWQGQFIFPLFYAQIFYLSFAVTAIFLLIKKGTFKNFKISWWEAFIFVLFFILAIRSRRHFPIFVFISLPFLASAFQDLFVPLSSLFKRKMGVIFINFFTLIILTILVYQVKTLPWFQNSLQDFCGKKYPCAAITYLKDHPELDSQRLFNEYDWGGYLLWAYPQRIIFIDGRMPQTEYLEHTILEEYLQFRQENNDISALLNDYQIDLVLLKPKINYLRLHSWEKIFFQISDSELKYNDVLKKYLDDSSDWRIIFKDDLSIIYQRNEY